MTQNVQFDSHLESRLEQAAQALGISRAELIQQAVARRCEEVLGPSLAKRLAPVIGRIESSGGRARHTGTALQRLLAKKRAR